VPVAKKPVVLTILDGWGYRPQIENNAIALARKPTYDKLLQEYPNTLLHASDHFVGLPDGQMGNSEVGHLNIGAGRIVQMDITRIDALIASGAFFTHPAIVEAMQKARKAQLHLFGLLSDGGVHSHQEHLYALLKTAKQQGVEKVFVHAFMDGRDTAPTGGAGYLAALEQKVREFGGKLASVSGRYYAMDRDRRWEREKKAFDAMVTGQAEGGAYKDPVARVKELVQQRHRPTSSLCRSLLQMSTTNRTERHPRRRRLHHVQLPRRSRAPDHARAWRATAASAKKAAASCHHGRSWTQPFRAAEIPSNLHYLCMTQYDKNFTLPMVIPAGVDGEPAGQPDGPGQSPQPARGRDGKVRARHLLLQRRHRKAVSRRGSHSCPVAERSRPTTWPRKCPRRASRTPSSKPSTTRAFDVVVVNFANADMVGHSGRLEPTIKAVETVDACLGRIYQAMKQRGTGAWLITADHGNAELMVDPVTGGPHTAHTTNPVPCIFVSEEAKSLLDLRPGGSLRDLSPTILGLLGLAQPKQMTGGDLRQRKA
jgi:2,3-bisphosphoglycerate-independent phosphoglycerate mutase